MREAALSLSIHFTRAQFFANHAHRVHSATAGPLTIALYATRGKGDNPIVCDLYFLTARWIVHAKIDSWEIYRTYKIFVKMAMLQANLRILGPWVFVNCISPVFLTARSEQS